MDGMRSIRIFVAEKLYSGAFLELSDKLSHYLSNVMRCRSGECVKCFNASDGEFICKITKIDKKKTQLNVEGKLRPAEKESDIWLLFAPLKKDKTDFVIEKAVELGVGKIMPVLTRYTNSGSVKTERMSAQAVEAAEQCGRMSVPEVVEAQKLENVLRTWPAERTLFFMDERRSGMSVAEAFKLSEKKSVAVLVGPEGGFDEEEAALLNRQPFVRNLNLGPRILRAETAAVAALSVWQAVAGDWIRENRK